MFIEDEVGGQRPREKAFLGRYKKMGWKEFFLLGSLLIF